MHQTAHEEVKVAMSLKPTSLSAAETDGAVIDTKGFREALVVALFGVAAASAEADVTVRESDAANGSGSSAVPAAAFTQVTTANDEAGYVGRINLEGRKRYLFTRNVGDGTNAVVLSTAIILLNPITKPVSQENTVAFNV